MKKCVNCGMQTTSANVTACEYCGGKLTDIENFVVSGHSAEMKEMTPRSIIRERKASYAKNAFMAVLVCVFVCLLSVCCFLLGQLYSDKDKDITTAEKKNEVTLKGSDSSAEADEPTVSTAKSGLPTNFDVEAAVKHIRAMYNETEETVFNETITHTATSVTAFCDPDGGEIIKIQVPADNFLDYERLYYFNDGELYFAFVFNGKKENRFYFNNGEMFRWIDEEYTTHDVINDSLAPSEFLEWKEFILEDSKEKMNLF